MNQTHAVQLEGANDPGVDAVAIARAVEAARTERGASLLDVVAEAPVLLVFLRHAGCTFCREALSDIAETRAAIEADGTRIVLVHLGDRAEIENVVRRYGLEQVDRICDPRQELYRAFGLSRGNWWQLMGPMVWWRGLVAGWFRGHGVSKPAADSAQMPGVFLIDKGLIVNSYRHGSASDRPCYVSLCEKRDSK